MPLRPDQLEDYRALLAEINGLAQEEILSLWSRFDGLDRRRLFEALRDGVPEVVAVFRSVAADSAVEFYASTQGVDFAPGEVAKAAEVNRVQLEKNLRWAVFNPGNVEMLALVGGIVQKHVLDGSRNYGLGGFRRAGAGWYRSARPQACEFCRVLATRAATDWGPYTSADAAITVGSGSSSRPSPRVPKGSTFHKNCQCIPVMASEYEVPEYVNEWAEEYYAAVEAVGNATDYRSILAEMRSLAGHSR